MSAPIQTVVLGGTGYVGGELLRLLTAHPSFELAAAVSESKAGEPIGETFGHLSQHYRDATFVSHDAWPDALEAGGKLALFAAGPHGASAGMIAAALDKAESKGIEVHCVDASADFRFKTLEEYEAVYGSGHGAPDLLAQFASGVPELAGQTDTPHIGNPGCFATAVQLAIVPLLRDSLVDGGLFVTGITGSTGSGKSPKPGTHHPERHSNLYAYKPLAHRHAPEIVHHATLASGHTPALHFVPHSGPFARGIHVTVHANAASGVDQQALDSAFDKAYGDAPFVSYVDGAPKLKDVVASNYCRVGATVKDDALVVMCVIDNLVKGASGGAIQWMNRLWSLPETAGLDAPAPAWT